GTMWSDFVSKGKDSWGVNDPEGRNEIFKLIEEKNIAGVLLISGDRHGARGFSIRRNSGFEFFEFGVASLGARVGPAKSKPKWESQLYGIDDIFAFGEFTFDATKGKEKVVFRLIHENGDIIYNKTLTLNELTPKQY
ncbi:MAG: alkaline phosphatase family protein, partial [Bacteroidetes bacterium]|nr:alkaline phosphatase family protein [Bacteroidota bacterium]